MDDADALRARLRDARAAEPAGLHESAHQRIVAQVRRHGPAQVRRSRRRRDLLRAAAVALPLALLGGWLGWGGVERTREAARSRSGGSAPAAACASRVAPRVREASQVDGTRRIDLDEIGQIMLARDSAATLASSDPCNIRLTLARGRASVHAANLFGGELRVRAGDVEVAVHGTTFAVERLGAEEVLVDVESGAVSVERAGRPAGALLRTGERMRLAHTDAPIRSPLAEEVRRELREAFDAALPARHAPPPNAVTRPPAPPADAIDASGVRAKPPAPSARMSGDAAPARARGDMASAVDPRVSPVQGAPGSPLGAAEPDAPRAPAQAPSPPARGSPPLGAPAPVSAAPLGAGSPKQTSRASSPQPKAAAALAPPPSAAALVARADAYWQAGDYDQARASYYAAGVLRGPTAEAAWLALARNELAARHVSAARSALASHARNFPDGKLAGEAAGIALRAALQARDLASAERIARQLLDHHPGTPQAAAAERWLRSREKSP